MGKARLAVAAGLLLFLLVLAYTWATHRDGGRFARGIESRIDEADRALAAAQDEQAALASLLDSAAAALARKKDGYEQKQAGESDPAFRSTWGSYRTGYLLAFSETVKIKDKLETLRGLAQELRGTAIPALKSPQRERLERLDRAVSAAVLLMAQAKTEISEQDSSLKEEWHKMREIAPAGASSADPAKRAGMDALESALTENEKTQELLSRLDRSADQLGKALFALQDILKVRAASPPP